MAGVSATLQMFDMMSQPIQQINQGVQSMVSSLGKLASSANQNIDLGSTLRDMNKATTEVSGSLNQFINHQDKANASMNEFINTENRVAQEQNKINSSLNEFVNTQNRVVLEQNKINNSFGQYTLTQDKLNNSLMQFIQTQEKVNNEQQKMNNTFNQSVNHTNNLISKVTGLVKSYLGFQAAKQGIESTIGGAMKMQQQLFTIQGIMGNKDIATGYFEHINDLANKSVFSLNDFAGSTRKFMQFTKNTDSLDKLLNLNERLALIDPTQGFDGAGFALKEMMSGDGVSLKERFGFGKADIEILKASKDMNSFISQFDKLLNKKGFTESMLEQYNKSAAAQFDNLKSNIETSLAQAGNGALEKLAPIFTQLNETFSNGGFQGFFNGLSNGLVIVINLVISLVNWVQWIGNGIQSNWGIISPIVWGIITALSAYLVVMGLVKVANIVAAISAGVSSLAADIYAASLAMQAGASFTATVAQYGLNAALYACPVTWIIIAIIALIAIFYAAVAAVNHFAGTSYSATGLIIGAFVMFGAYVYNVIAYVWNVVAAYVEFLANVFTNPIYSIKKLFVNLASTVLDMCISMTSGFDNFATNMANAMIDGINIALDAWNGFVDILNGLGIAEKLGLGKADKIGHTVSITSDLQNMKGSLNDWLGEAPSDYWTAPRMEMKSLGGAFDWGYGKGAGFESSVGNMLNGLGSVPDGAENSIPDFDSWNKTQGPGELSFGNDDKKNLKNISDKVDVSNEHLEMLRDMAEEKSIQNFVTLTPTVTFGDTHVKEEADINKIISHIENYMENELQNSAEGLYA